MKIIGIGPGFYIGGRGGGGSCPQAPVLMSNIFIKLQGILSYKGSDSLLVITKTAKQ